MIVHETPGCTCGRKPLSSAKVFMCARVIHGARDQKAGRANVRRDMVRMRRQLMIEGQRHLSKLLMSFFKQKIDELCDRIESRAGQSSAMVPGQKATYDFSFGGSAEIWKAALDEVLGNRADIELIADYLPAVQSVAARSYARTCILIGEEQDSQASVQLLRRAQNLARSVTRINDTTRTQLSNRIADSIANGDTVAETARAIREAIPELSRSRVSCIARTEVGNAVDEGTKQAFRESSVVATVDVIGCQSVEPNCPMFDGRPTCNITGVDAHRVDELIFHPNHTGALVPGSFVND